MSGPHPDARGREERRTRRLFCDLSPCCYAISVFKGCLARRLRDLFSRERFARVRTAEALPVRIYRHKSLIRRRLGGVEMELQENKAVNLALAAPRISGVLIRPGETFSLWRLVGRTSVRKGYREGLIIKRGSPDRGIGGGLCQLSNLIHWIVLHTPFVITEYHHHDGVDLFPDFGRQVPFGVGTSISYNYLDYRFRNETDQTFRLVVHTDETYLTAELQAEHALETAYHIESRDEHFIREGGVYFRCGEVRRRTVDKRSGRTLADELLKVNRARVMYDARHLAAEKIRER